MIDVEASTNSTMSSSSPVLPKKSVKPRVLQIKQGLPKPKFISKEMALKPRNGRPTARAKQGGPIKPSVSILFLFVDYDSVIVYLFFTG